MATRIRPEETEIDFSSKQPIPDMRSVMNDEERESAASKLRQAKTDNPVEHHASDIDDFRERQTKSNADYQSRRAAEESEAAVREDQSKRDKQEYHHGGKVCRTGTARLKKNETIDGKLVPETGLYRVKRGEQVLTPEQQAQQAPVSRWQRYGNQESGSDQQSRLLGW